MMRSVSPCVSTSSRKRSVAVRFKPSATPLTSPLLVRCGGVTVAEVFGKPAPSRNTRSTMSFGPPRPSPRAAPPPCVKSCKMFSSIHLRVSLASPCLCLAARSFPATHSPTTMMPRISPSPAPLPDRSSLRLLTPHVASQSRLTPSLSQGTPSFSKIVCIRCTIVGNCGFRI